MIVDRTSDLQPDANFSRSENPVKIRRKSYLRLKGYLNDDNNFQEV